MTQRKEVPGVPLPEHFVEARSFYERLREDPGWLRAKMGKYLAIIGQQIVDEADNYPDLSKKVRKAHGYGHIFMPHVTENYPEVHNAPSASPLDKK